MQAQSSFPNPSYNHRLCHGGSLRRLRKGRGYRPLSSKCSIHLVLKANRKHMKTGFRQYQRFSLIQKLLEKYKNMFEVKVEQFSIQGDHIHLLIRSTRRSNYQSFFRVFAGQIAQRFEKEGWLRVTDTPNERIKKKVSVWKQRPFTRVIDGGWRGLQIVRNYIQLNEKEALGEIPYRKERLRGLSMVEWEHLWVT